MKGMWICWTLVLVESGNEAGLSGLRVTVWKETSRDTIGVLTLNLNDGHVLKILTLILVLEVVDIRMFGG